MTTTPTPDLAALREIVNTAHLNGPIETKTIGLDMGGYHQIAISQAGTQGPQRTVLSGQARGEHSDLIVAAVNSLPGLLAYIEGQTADLEQARADWEREHRRTEMMAYQRGAVLAAVHQMKLGNHTVVDVAARVEEIFARGMTAEVRRGWGDELAHARAEAQQNKANWKACQDANLKALETIERMRPVVEAAQAWHKAMSEADHMGVQVHDAAAWRASEDLCTAVHPYEDQAGEADRA